MRTDAVVRASEPRIQVKKDKPNHRQIGFSFLRLGPFRNDEMLIAPAGKRRIAWPVTCHHHSSGLSSRRNEAAQRLGVTIGHDFQAQASRVTATMTGHGAAVIGLPMAHLNGSYDMVRIVDPASLVTFIFADLHHFNFDNLACGFIKKTKTTPESELKNARKRQGDYKKKKEKPK